MKNNFNRIIPASVIDNFFDDPDMIRSFALAQSFDSPRGAYPGYRSEQIAELDKNLYDSINSRVLSLFFNQYKDALDIEVESQFQYIPEVWEGGWIHQDTDVYQRNVAGVIYLTPNAPLDAGTSIYREISDPDYEDLRLRNEFYHRGTVDDMEKYRQARDRFNSNYERVLDIKNVYNRLIVYDCLEFHKESGFFGKEKEDARLTLVFFMTIRPVGNTSFPGHRMKSSPITMR